MDQKLEFTGSVFQQLIKHLSVVDSFKGNWKSIELRHSKHSFWELQNLGSPTRPCWKVYASYGGSYINTNKSGYERHAGLCS